MADHFGLGARVDLRELQYFVKIAVHGSITKAAGHLRVAQPASGWKIKQLEQQLGAEPLIRGSSGIRLSDSGRNLFEHALAILRAAKRTENEVRSSGRRPAGRVARPCRTTGAGSAPPLLEYG